MPVFHPSPFGGKKMKYAPIVWAAFLCVFVAGCTDDTIGTPSGNKRPQTHLATPVVNTIQSSQIHVHWYGDDPDGFVAGYLFSWDRKTWHYTPNNDSLFSLRINANDSSYTFSVAALDNSLGNIEKIVQQPIAFVDANSDGVYNDGEEFVGLQGAVDPTPATVTYRIVNSAPQVFFGADSTEAARAIRQNPDTTFTVASFLFSVYDKDGKTSINNVEWSLNDSTASAQWHTVPATQTLLTLREADGLRLNADNVLYLRATDNGGMTSTVASYPERGKTWYVRKPKGTILVINDGGTADANAFYTQTLNSIASGKFASAYDVLDIRRGATDTKPPDNLPLLIAPTFTETLKLFKTIIWYSDLKPSLELAQQVLPEFNRNGGKVLLCTGLPTSVEATGALVDFAPVDSASTFELPGFPQALKNGSTISADASVTAVYPHLVKERGNVAGIHALYPKVTATVLYRLPENAAYTGTPVVGVRSGSRDFVFLNIPLHLFTTGNTAQTMLENTMVQEFGL